MCGILAVFCNALPKQLKNILSSGSYLARRGPDHTTSIIQSSGIYIFHRLAINDLSDQGNQPMQDSGILMMCNGEIYNHNELRQEYGLKCRSNSDCEVILRLYQKFGFVETIKKLHGVFAIVLVDKVADKIYLARDRIGVRPLYFGMTEEKFLAVSSIPNSLITFANAICQFPPGLVAQHNPGSQNVIQYLHIDNLQLGSMPPCPEEQLYIDIRLTLMNAVKMRLLSDRPIGCLLSGGVDSSIIASILVSFLGADKVRTYSIGMEGSTDLFYARKVAMHLGTQHHEVLFTPQEGIEVISEVIQCLGSYDITTVRASVGMYLISRYISTHTNDKVIFSGEGSDEIFGGYLYFHNAPNENEAGQECLRLTKNLYLYDVLRADRCVSCHGLEPRVPFLDKDMVNLALSMPCSQKLPRHNYEKYALRKAFEGYLPEDVLWRRKEGFSDGVSSLKKPWYSYIQEYAEKKIDNEIFNPRFPSKEAMYYKLLFDRHFPDYNLKINYWMPRWTQTSDPSGRLISAYDEKMQK